MSEPVPVRPAKPDYLISAPIESHASIDSRIIAIRNVFKINDNPELANISNKLLSIAFLNNCGIVNSNHCKITTLAYYGDRIMYTIMVDIMYDIYGLHAGSHTLTQIQYLVASNNFYINIMLAKDACKYLKVKSQFVDKNCADAFEALIGAFFVHLRFKNYIQIIKAWVLENTGIKEFIENYASYKIDNTVTKNTFKRLKKLNKELVNPSTNYIIINNKLPINIIYKLLNLDFEKSVIKSANGYSIRGPGGHVFGTGNTLLEAQRDTINNLINYGYIVLKL